MHTLLQNCDAAIVITKCVTYYKMRRYYKMPQNTLYIWTLCLDTGTAQHVFEWGGGGGAKEERVEFFFGGGGSLGAFI